MTQFFEGQQGGYAEISPTQASAFTGAIDSVRPLLDKCFVDLHDSEPFFDDLPLGEIKVEIVDDETKIPDEREKLGELTLTNLGGMIELGPGIMVPTDPMRYTQETNSASFVIEGKGVDVVITTDTVENLRDALDTTTSTEYKVTVTEKSADDTYEYSNEKVYRYLPHQGSGYSETVRRRKSVISGPTEPWVCIAGKDDPLRKIVERAQLVREGKMSLDDDRAQMKKDIEASDDAYKDESREHPGRFDQNRFAEVMRLIDQVDISNRSDSAPAPVQQSSGFKIVLE